MMNQYARVGAPTIAAMRRCRVIARYGVGVDIVDVEAATAKGILVTNVRDYCTEEVADHAIALWLTLARKIAALRPGHASGHLALEVGPADPPPARTDRRHRVLRQDWPGDRGARQSLRRRSCRLRPVHPGGGCVRPRCGAGRKGRASRALRRHLHAGTDDARHASLSRVRANSRMMQAGRHHRQYRARPDHRQSRSLRGARVRQGRRRRARRSGGRAGQAGIVERRATIRSSRFRM